MSQNEDTERTLILYDERGIGIAKQLEIKLNKRKTHFIVNVDIWACKVPEYDKIGVSRQ